MDGGQVTPVNHGDVVIFRKPKMGKNSVIYGMMLRYDVVVVCSDYVVKNTNMNKR